MGSYATLTLGSLELGASKNEVDPGLILFFRPSDKLIERIDRKSREQLAKYVEKEYIDNYDEDNLFTRVEYRCAATVARDRLDLKGFTYEVAEASLKAGIEAKIQQYEWYLKCEPYLTHNPNAFDKELHVLRSLTIESWLKALGRIQEERLTKEILDGLPSTDVQLPLLQYMLGHSQGCSYFPELDYRLFARLAVEAMPPQEQIVLDLSDLVAGGWIDETDDMVVQTEALFNGEFLLTQRVIVLTEGDTDRQILERSLKLLYPHLVDYFHFFDFTGKKVGGGAGELANLVRAFAAADVRHRILALFDNDTAARTALSNLNSDILPNNIAIHHYPDSAIAQDYLTLGPSGEAKMNVNGLAGSIELYLGQDVLRDSCGKLLPVQWTGYDRKANAYQGEVVYKQNILEKFYQKLNLCETHPEQVGSHDWEGIRAILDTMRTAFHDIDAEAILRRETYE